MRRFAAALVAGFFVLWRLPDCDKDKTETQTESMGFEE
jgi:hypothetical protein